MEITPVNDTSKRPATMFTGDVYATPLAPAVAPARLSGALVRFTPGARTFWHMHEQGQTLYVTEGIGLVASRGGNVTRIQPGDTVTIGPGEEHWHGATSTTCMSHLALVTAIGDSDPTTWLEAVSDEEYAASHRATSELTDAVD